MYRKLRKGLCLIFLSFLIIFQTLFPNFVRADESNMEIYYDNVISNVQAGESVVYRLNVRVTGFNSATQQKSRKLVITLPGGKEGMTKLDIGGYANEAAKLQSMAITIPTDTTDSGVIDIVPKVVNTNNGSQLEYDFGTNLQSGVSYSIEIPLKVANGIVQNGQKLSPHAIYYENGNVAKNISLPQSTVSSDTSVSISKTYQYAEGHQNDPSYTPRNGDILVWQIKANVPYQPFGLAYIKPGTNVTITDKIEGNYHEFFSASDGGTNSNGTVTWNIPAPAESVQGKYDRANEQNIFEKTVTVRTKVKNVNVSGTIKNKSDVRLTNISNAQKTATSNEATVLVAGGGNTNPPRSESGLIQGYTVGPTNGTGGFQVDISKGNYNPNPTVSGSANLTFGIFYRVALNTGPNFNQNMGELPYKVNDDGDEVPTAYPATEINKRGYQSVRIVREIDPKLVLQEIELGLPAKWGSVTDVNNPLREFGNFGADMPRTFIDLQIADNNGTRVKTVPVSFKNLKPDPLGRLSFKADGSSTIDTPMQTMILTRADLGLNSDEKVTGYTVQFVRPGGLVDGSLAENIYDRYTVKPGETGQVSNTSYYDVVLWNGDHFYRRADPYFPPSATAGSMGPRTAVIERNEKYKTSIGTAVEFEKREGNTVNLGENVVKFSINANYPTPANAMVNSTATLLPLGVTVDRSKWNSKKLTYTDGSGNVLETLSNEVEVVDNFNNTGRQLIRVKWNNKELSGKQTLDVQVPVTVSKDADKQFTVPVYASVNNVDFDVIAPVKKETDTQNATGKGSNSSVATTSTQYVLINRNDLKIEKFVKGNIDEGFSKFGYATIGGDVEYRLQMTNTSGEKVKKMAFIDILPSAGDKGIINATDRGSKFTPTLTGPITLPSEWQDKVDVFYSTATNPKRDDINNMVDYPQGATPIANPNGAQDPNWMTQAQVGNNWSNIHSFKIQLKAGVEWIEGQHIVVKFKMRTPLPRNNQEKQSDIYTGKGSDADRAAWNSFAVTANGLLPVEPERVGVALMPPLHFKVKKKDQFGNDIKTGTMDLKFWIDQVQGNTRNFYSNDGRNINLSTTNPFTFNQQLDNASTFDSSGKYREKLVYVVTEERAPVGYKKTGNQYYVEMDMKNRTVTWTKTVDANGKETKVNKLLYNEQDADNEITLDIVNEKQVLPKTGGYGAIFYILIGGSLIFISRKIKKRNIDLGEE